MTWFWYRGKARRTSWTHVKREALIPSWNNLSCAHADGVFAGVSPAADFNQLSLLIKAVLIALFMAPFEFMAMAFSENAYSPPRRTYQYKAQSPFSRTADRSTPDTPKQTVSSTGFFSQLRLKLFSFEFWLGLSAGIVTRIAARNVIETALHSTNTLSGNLTSLAACAGAGLAAGMVVHLVRTAYRNANSTSKESYGGMGLINSALTGLFGGVLGGGVAQIGATIAQAGSLAVSAGTGVTVGVISATVNGARAHKAGDGSNSWKQQLVHGALFGATGGVLGVVSADLLTAHDAIAAPSLSDGHWNISLPIATDPSAVSPMHSVTVESGGMPPHLQPPPQQMANNIPSPPPPTATSPDVICYPVVHHPHHVHHHRHRHHHLTHHHIVHKHVTPVKVLVVINEPSVIVFPLPPPEAVIPIAGPPPAPPMPYNSCDMNNGCEPPCPEDQQVNVQGPCADPGNMCVERVSFNNDGQATHVVLEPSVGQQMASAHFEVARPQQVAANDDGDASKVSLVMPFNGRGMVTPAMV